MGSWGGASWKKKREPVEWDWTHLPSGAKTNGNEIGRGGTVMPNLRTGKALSWISIGAPLPFH